MRAMAMIWMIMLVWMLLGAQNARGVHALKVDIEEANELLVTTADGWCVLTCIAFIHLHAWIVNCCTCGERGNGRGRIWLSNVVRFA